MTTIYPVVGAVEVDMAPCRKPTANRATPSPPHCTPMTTAVTIRSGLI